MLKLSVENSPGPSPTASEESHTQQSAPHVLAQHELPGIARTELLKRLGSESGDGASARPRQATQRLPNNERLRIVEHGNDLSITQDSFLLGVQGGQSVVVRSGSGREKIEFYGADGYRTGAEAFTQLRRLLRAWKAAQRAS